MSTTRIIKDNKNNAKVIKNRGIYLKILISLLQDVSRSSR